MLNKFGLTEHSKLAFLCINSIIDSVSFSGLVEDYNIKLALQLLRFVYRHQKLAEQSQSQAMFVVQIVEKEVAVFMKAINFSYDRTENIMKSAYAPCIFSHLVALAG